MQKIWTHSNLRPRDSRESWQDYYPFRGYKYKTISGMWQLDNHNTFGSIVHTTPRQNEGIKLRALLLPQYLQGTRTTANSPFCLYYRLGIAERYVSTTNRWEFSSQPLHFLIYKSMSQNIPIVLKSVYKQTYIFMVL